MKLEPLLIKKIVNKGYGFAHLSTGQVALVRHVLPGEKVIVTAEQTKKNYLFGKVQQILEKHPARRRPPCKYYGQCGGCNLQHCNYSTQLIIKKGIVRDLLLRQRDEPVLHSTNLLADPIPSPFEFEYRQRIRLQVGEHGKLGFHRFQSHDIIQIDSCLLAGESINRTITALREHDDGRKLCGLATEVDLQLNPHTRTTVCIFHFTRKVRPADTAAAISFCKDTNSLERVYFIGTDFPITGPFGQSEQDDFSGDDKMANKMAVHYSQITGLNNPLLLTWEAGGFCQVNLSQNKLLIETVMAFCGLQKSETVLDLYCGMGNFSIPLARRAKSVFGIEGQGSAIRSAKENAILAGVDNTQFLKNPVHKACHNIAESCERFDCVILDPPRQGAPDLAKYLEKITTKRLIYISCDPATLCRDLVSLIASGFTIRRIQPIDMFPQTHHIENVVLLEK